MPNNASVILRRMMDALGTRTQSAFAKQIGITPPTISSAIERGRIPALWLYKVAYLTGHSPEWLRGGTQPEDLPRASSLGKDLHEQGKQAGRSSAAVTSTRELRRPRAIREREERLHMEFLEALPTSSSAP